MALTILVGVLLLLLAVRVPIGLAMLGSAIAFVAYVGIPVLVIPQQLYSGLDSFALLAMPLFVFAGLLMNSTGISERVIDFSLALVGHLRGGLSFVVVVANVVLGGPSGSGVADVAAVGSVTIPAMVKRGYPAEFAAAVNASAASIAILIPPSIPMVFYGIVSGTSIGAVFAAGVIPGLLTAIALMAVCRRAAIQHGFGKEVAFERGRLWQATLRAAMPLLAVVLVLFLILAGVLTPTETAAFLVFYVLVLGAVYRELSWEAVATALRETVVITGVVLVLIGGSTAFGHALAYERVPQMLGDLIGGLDVGTIGLLVVMSLLMIASGAVLHGDPIMFVIVPILLPTVKLAGIDPVVFGLVVLMCIAIGQQTPPVASVLFVAASIAKRDLISIAKADIPFLVATTGVLLLLILFPDLVTFVPRQLDL